MVALSRSENLKMNVDQSTAGVEDYFELLKPRVMSLAIFTAIIGLLLTPNHIHPFLAVFSIIAIGAGAGAAAGRPGGGMHANRGPGPLERMMARSTAPSCARPHAGATRGDSQGGGYNPWARGGVFHAPGPSGSPEPWDAAPWDGRP